VSNVISSFGVGAALGGVASAHLIAAYGWRSVLVLGGVLPLLLAPVLWVILPGARSQDLGVNSKSGRRGWLHQVD
jgi:MFS family permease